MFCSKKFSRKFTNLICFLAYLGILGASFSALSFDTRINGFMNVVSSVSNKSTPFLNDISNKVNYSRDTNAGISLNTDISDHWALTTLLVGRADPVNKTHGVQIDKAFATYRPADFLHIRIGQQDIPNWIFSEYTWVGYIYPWIRLPSMTVNSGGLTTKFYGARSDFIIHMPPYFRLTIGLAGGSTKSLFPQSSYGRYTQETRGDGTGLYNTFIELAHDNFLLRAAYTANNNVDLSTTNYNYSPYSAIPLNSEFYQKTPWENIVHARSSYVNLSAKANIKGFFNYTEWSKTTMAASTKDTEWYTSFGYTWKFLTPHFTYSYYNRHFYKESAAIRSWVSFINTLVENELSNRNIPVPLRAPYRSTLYIQGRDADQVLRIYTLGLNFKITETSVAKIDYQILKPQRTQDAKFFNISSPGFDGGVDGQVNIVNVSYNAIF